MVAWRCPKINDRMESDRMKLPEKARKMVAYLQEQICVGAYRPGTKLPSIRDFEEQFSISYTSAMRGIDYLCSIGLAEKYPRSGVFVKKADGKGGELNNCKIALFVSGGELRKTQSIYSTVFLGIQGFAEENRSSLLLNYMSVPEAKEEKIVEMSKGADALIFMAEYDDTLESLSIGIPAVGVCMHKSLSGNLSIVDIDPYQVAELAAEYYRRHKLDEIVIVSREDIPLAYRNREEVFADLWRKCGGKVESAILSDKLKPCDGRGYFFSTSSLLQVCSENILRDTGKILADQAVVLGVDGKNIINPEFHRAPSIALDWQTAGRCAMEECMYRIKNKGSLPKRIYLPGRLVLDAFEKRSSFGNVKRKNKFFYGKGVLYAPVFI